jgi:hypothetical protein
MQHYSLGPTRPCHPLCRADPWDASRLSPRSPVCNWCPTSGKHTGPAAGIPPRRGFEQGFSSRESGHFRICRKEFGLCLNPSYKVAALGGLTAVVCGASRQPGGAVVGTAIGRDALVCGGQRAVDPGPGGGDWLSGRAPRSHRGGHWFDPSIAHPGQASSPRGTGLRRLSCRNGCSCHRPSRLCAPRRTPYPALRICSRRMSACPQCWANSRRVCR